MDDSTTPRKHPDLEYEELEEDILIHQPDTGKVHNLNPTASFVWTLCNGERSIGTIVDEIVRSAPETDRATVREDVEELIDNLIDEQLLVLPDQTEV